MYFTVYKLYINNTSFSFTMNFIYFQDKKLKRDFKNSGLNFNLEKNFKVLEIE